MCERGRGGSARVRRVCMCALLTTTHVAPSIHSTVWGLNVHVCVCVFVCIYVCAFLPECLLKCFPVCVLNHIAFVRSLQCSCVCFPGRVVVVDISERQHMCSIVSPYIISCRGSTVCGLESLPRLPSQHREQSEALFNPAECTSHI